MILQPDKMINAFRIIIEVKNWDEYARWYLKIPPKTDFIKLRNGIMHRVRKNDMDKWVIDEVWIQKFYNPPGFEIKENDIVIDIGGHIGTFSIFAAMHAKKGKVFSFEPFPESYGILRENIGINRLANVEASNLGISGKRGTCRLYIDERGSCCNSMYRKNENFIEVECITLEDVFSNYNIEKCDFLKIDCEGWEYEIIFTAPDEIFEKIDKISLEYHDQFVKEYTVGMLREFLEKKGFTVSVKKPMLYAIKKT